MDTVVVEKSDALVKIVESSGLEKNKAAYILERFQDYFKIAAEWEKKAGVLVVTSETQVAEMKMAREGRLFLKQKRVDIEKARKELKEQSLREGKAIDGIANVLRALIEPIENYLEEQEKFIEIREDRVKEERRSRRVVQLQELGLDPILYDLKNMPEQDFQGIVVGQRALIQQKIEAEKRAEEERVAREKEQERIRIENEQLHIEAEKKERQLAQEMANAERERRAIEEKMLKAKVEAEAREKKLRVEQEAKLKKQREETERIRAELKAKVEAEAREKKRLEDEDRAARSASDKKKLMILADTIESLELPEIKSREAAGILVSTRELLKKTSAFVREKAANLS